MTVLMLQTGCSQQKVVDIPEINLLPSLKEPCDNPVEVPEKELTQENVENLWIKDRISLINCKKKKDSIVDIIQELS